MHNPKIIIAGGSTYSRVIDFKNLEILHPNIILTF